MSVDRTRGQSSTTLLGVLSSSSNKQRSLVPPPPPPLPPSSDPTLPLRSPGGGTYSTGGSTLQQAPFGDYGWQRTALAGPSCLLQPTTTTTIGDPFDCDLVMSGTERTSTEMQQCDLNECQIGQRWMTGTATAAADDDIAVGIGPAAVGGEVEVNYGLRWATYRAACPPSVGSSDSTTIPSPCRTTIGGVSTGCASVDVLHHHQHQQQQQRPRSPMSSFGTRWTGVRTHFYEVPAHWNT